MEPVAAFIAEQKAVIGLFVLAGMFAAFVWERFSPSVVAVAGAGTMLALGLLDEKGAYGGFSNSAPLTVGAMFILSGALIRTGVIDKVGNYVVDRAKRNPRLAVIEVFGGGLLVSGFINSTPFVVVMMPVCFRLAEALGRLAQEIADAAVGDRGARRLPDPDRYLDQPRRLGHRRTGGA